MAKSGIMFAGRDLLEVNLPKLNDRSLVFAMAETMAFTRARSYDENFEQNRQQSSKNTKNGKTQRS